MRRRIAALLEPFRVEPLAIRLMEYEIGWNAAMFNDEDDEEMFFDSQEAALGYEDARAGRYLPPFA